MKGNDNQVPREQWKSSLGFILAAAGSAIGLGNIWKFPYVTGENGGGAFVLIYLLCIAIIGLPVMLCEITLGRHTQRNPVGAFKAVTPPASTAAHLLGGGMTLTGIFMLVFQQYGWGVLCIALGMLVFKYSWSIVGFMGVLAGFIILSFYSVVAGWTIGYIYKAVTVQLAFTNVDVATSHFVGFVGNWQWSMACHFAFMLLCTMIVYRGVQKGIEKWSKILMPVLLLLLVVLITRGLTLPGAIKGVRFFLNPDFTRINANSILVALGHAFFSLSLGMGAMITYGSYVRKEDNIFTASLSIVALDTLIALLAGLALFPAVFALGFDPKMGPGLIFNVLPTVFNHMTWGPFWAALFFVLILIAALTSGISLLEVVTAYFVDERKWSRRTATVTCASIIFVLGAFSVVSCDAGITGWGPLKHFQAALVAVFGGTKGCFLDVADNLASNWLLPLGGLFIAIFVGWIWGTRKAVAEIRHGSHNFADVHLISLLAGLKDDPAHNSEVHVITLASVWGIFIRFISPVAVLIAFLNTMGWLEFSAPAPTPDSDAQLPPTPAELTAPAVEEVPPPFEPNTEHRTLNTHYHAPTNCNLA